MTARPVLRNYGTPRKTVTTPNLIDSYRTVDVEASTGFCDLANGLAGLPSHAPGRLGQQLNLPVRSPYLKAVAEVLLIQRTEFK